LKFRALLLLCFLLPLFASAQSSFVIPVQSTSGQAISGAIVTLVCTDSTSGCAGQGPFTSHSLNGNAPFTGIPSGNYTVTVAGPLIQTFSYAFTVGSTFTSAAIPPGSSLTLTGLNYAFSGATLPFASAYRTIPYAGQVQASNGTAPYTFSITGALPAGILAGSCSGRGGPVCTFAGTPTTTGVTTFSVGVTDANGFTQTLSITITVYSATSVTVAPSGQSIAAGATLQMSATATENDPAATVLPVTSTATWASTAGGMVNASGLLTAGGGSGGGTFSLVQAPAITTCSAGTTCAVTVSSTGTGHAIIVEAYFLSSTNQITSIGDTKNTYTLCPGSSAAPNGLDCSLNLPWWQQTGYVLNSVSGATTITVTLPTSETSWKVAVAEVALSGSGTSIQFDAGVAGFDSTCTTCAGLSLSSWITGTNDYIFQMGGPLNSLTAITGGYTTPALFSTVGFAGLPNTTSGTAPNWTQSSGGGVTTSALALRAVGGSSSNPSITAAFDGQTSPGVTVTVTGTTTTFACTGVVTSTLQTAITAAAAAAKTLEITPGSCTTGPLTLPANTSLLLDSGVTIGDVAGYASTANMLNINAANVTIGCTGPAATCIFQMPLSQAQSISDGSQYRHCLGIGNPIIGGAATNVTVSGISCNYSGGDGIYIGTATSVTVQDSVFDHNYRNGGSLTGSVSGISFLRNHFTNSCGTLPKSGFDIEPNSSSASIQGVTFLKNWTDYNCGDGIEFELENLTSASPAVSISVVGHNSDSNGRYGYIGLNAGVTNPTGTVSVQNSFSNGDGS
jgi:hypothetical protein